MNYEAAINSADNRKVVYSESVVTKTMVIISDYTLVLKEDSSVFG